MEDRGWIMAIIHPPSSILDLPFSILDSSLTSPRKMARHPVAGFFFKQLGLAFGADAGGFRTAVAEAAAARQMKRTRHHARNRIQPLFLRAARAGQRMQQTDGG